MMGVMVLMVVVEVMGIMILVVMIVIVVLMISSGEGDDGGGRDNNGDGCMEAMVVTMVMMDGSGARDGQVMMVMAMLEVMVVAGMVTVDVQTGWWR